ncbi:MAG: hypothetical protein WDA21_00955 [Bacilli bacterium]
MKKYGLLKVLSISILVLVFLTWIIPTSTFDGATVATGERSMVGLWELFNFPNDSIAFFGDYILFIILIGAFYGILNKIGAYRSLLEKITEIFKGKEKWFLVGLMVVLGFITSISGLTIELFIFIPLIISIILSMGYDKMVALSSTVGAILVGLIGSTLGYYGAGVLNSVLGLEFNAEILVKIFLFIIPMYLLVSYTLNYAKRIESKEEKEAVEDPLLLSKKKVKVCLWPVIAILAFIAVISILGYVSWDFAFNTNVFTNFHNWVMGIHIGNFYIFEQLFGGSSPFGGWWLSDLSIILLFMIVLLGIIYKVKLNDVIESVVDGIKKVIPVVAVIILINIIFLIAYNNQINITILDWLLGGKFNYLTMALNGMIQSTMFVYLPYAAAYTLPAATAIINDSAVNGQMGVIFQAVFGVIMFVAPTSLILLTSLAYTDTSYGKWLKYIGKLFLEILLVVIAILTIMVLV